MMATLRLSRLRVRYRLPAEAADSRSRLDGVLREVVAETLEHALTRSGIATHQEICIRRLGAPVRLGLRNTDSALAATWSIALAESIRGVIEEGGPDVVRYANINHALTDMLCSVAAGQLDRAWAWRQLGLWGDGDAVAAGGGEAMTRALLAHPEAIVGVLAASAHELPRLARMIPVSAWGAITRAALGTAIVPDADIAWFVDHVDGKQGHPLAGAGSGDMRRSSRVISPIENVHSTTQSITGPKAEVPEGATVEIVKRSLERIVRRSSIASALDELPVADARLRHLLAILALLEADPSELRRGNRRTEHLIQWLAWSGSSISELPSTRIALAHPSDREVSLEKTQTFRAATGIRSQMDPRQGSDTGDLSAVESTSQVHRQVADHSEREFSGAQSISAETAIRPLPALHPEESSAWGGLLFLLHVFQELHIPEEVERNEYLRERGIRWVMHRIALELLDTPEDDPAVLAFTGTSPHLPAPSSGEPHPTYDEIREIRSLADRVSARFLERLDGSRPEPEQSQSVTHRETRLRAAMRRRARIVVSPGWFDIVLALDEVSVEIRRAGLDLDPGWVPWLGVVVSFVYE